MNDDTQTNKTQPRTLMTVLVVGSILTLTIFIAVGSYQLGLERSAAEIHKHRADIAEQQALLAMQLVEVVNRAKVEEFMSCVQAGRDDCAAKVTPEGVE